MDLQSTLVQMKNETNALRFQQGRDNLGKTSLGKDAFLQILLAQLQHQDPLNPVEDTEFISQQAQFTQIEKLDQLIDATNSSNTISQASTLVGKHVALMRENGQTLTGRVDSVSIGSNGVGLNVGDQIYTMDQVVQIFSEPPS